MDGYFQYASVVLPAPSLASNSTAVLKLVDPLIYNLATFFAQLLNTNLLPRFVDEAKHCGVNHAALDNWLDGYAVAQTTVFPLNNLTLKDTDYKFPLLNVIVEEEYPDQLTLTNTAIVRDVCVSWVLPPLTARQYNRLYQFFGEATKVWTGYGRQGYDPKVNSNSVWEACNVSFGTLNSVDYVDFYGFDKEGKEAGFPAIAFRASFWETEQEPVPQNYKTLSSIYLQTHLVDGYNPANPILDFVDGYIQPDITLTSCTPNSGTVHGNTLIVIEGTGFDPQKVKLASQLTICGAMAKALSVKSPTVMMAITNPGISTGTGNVVFTDLEGNTYTLTNGFTYT